MRSLFLQEKGKYGSGYRLIFGADPDPTFPLRRIRIRLLMKVMQICNHWPRYLPKLHCEP
jgi:hypothetical protein